MAEISDTDLPYLALECPDLKDQQLVGGRFKYRAGSGFRRRRRRGGYGAPAWAVGLNPKYKAIKSRGRTLYQYRMRNGKRVYKSKGDRERAKLHMALKRFRSHGFHRDMLLLNRKRKVFKYRGPGVYRVRRR